MQGRSLVVLVLVALLTACGTARRGEAVSSPPTIRTAEEARGQSVFMLHCQQCHPGGAGGLGPGINDKPLPGFMIRWQVRRGFGAMPSFSEEQIGKDDLDDLIAYLRSLRRARQAAEAPGPS